MMRHFPHPSGLLLPEAAFAEPPPAETREIATTADGRDITRGYVDQLPLLPPGDSILRARGAEDYRLYDEVLRDDQVAATFAQRRLAVVGREWEVLAGGERPQEQAAAQSLREMLEGLNTASADADDTARAPLPGFDATTDKMLYAVFWGFAVGEALWARDGRHVVLEGVRVRRQRRFGFGPDGRLRLKTTRHPLGEDLPPRKFWVFATGSDHDDEPYGLGLAHWLYWPTLFKRHDIRFWLVFLEKFGMPTGVGRYGRNATTEERSKLLAAVRAIRADTGIILPEGMAVELMEASRSGTVDYAVLHAAMDAAIAKVVLGQTLTTQVGDSGSRALGDVHMDVRQDLVKADADLVCASFNATIARWLTDWNYPGAAYPRVWRRLDDEPDLKPQAERDKLIFNMGFRPSLDYIHSTYGGEWDLAGARAAAPAPGAGDGSAFAEDDPAPAQAALDAALEALSPELLHSESAAMVTAVRAAFAAGAEAPDLLERLAAAYPQMDDTALTEHLTRVLFAAEVFGRLSLQGDLTV